MTITHRTPSRFVAFAAFLACLGLPACGPVKGYPGASRDASEIATIWPSPPDTQIGTIVQSVDGMAVNAEVELTVLPGTRTLILQLVPYSLQEMNQSGGGAEAAMQTQYNLEWKTVDSIEVAFEAGTEYDIVGRWNAPMYEVQIVGRADRAVIWSKAFQAIRNTD